MRDGHVSLPRSRFLFPLIIPPFLPPSLSAVCVGCRSGNIHNASSSLLMDRAFQLHQHCGRVQQELWHRKKACVTLEPLH